MSSTTLHAFKWKKLSHLGKDPNIEVIINETTQNGLDLSISLNFKKLREYFDHDCDLYLSVFDKKGISLFNERIASFEELINDEKSVVEYIKTVNGAKKDNISLRFLLSKPGNYNGVNVSRVVASCEINKLGGDTQTGDSRRTSLLPSLEDEIGPAYCIRMRPEECPQLILKQGTNIKYKLDDYDVIHRTLIYTAAIREVITTYLIDTDFESCSYKKKWFKQILKVVDKKEEDIPNFFLDRNNIQERAINKQAVKFIESVVTEMVSNLLYQRDKKTLMELFILENNKFEKNENDFDED